MKGGSLNGMRGKQLSLTLMVVCTTILIWVWEQTPSNVHFLQSWESFDTYNPVVVKETSAKAHVNYEHQQSSMENDPTERARQGGEVTKKGNNADLSQTESPSTALPVQNIEQLRKKMNIHPRRQQCNYAKGRWVADSRRPLYSGFGCKRWLSGMWACRLTQRTDFAYESFRWQPESCDMPEFDRNEVLKRMQDKTIALVGDSLGRQQFQSLMCILTGGEEDLNVEDVGIEYGLVKAPGAKRPDGWAYRFPQTNTTVLYYWSASLCELQPLNISDPSTKFAMHLDRPATFLQRYLHRFDVLVLNTGHHWNRGKLIANRWEMYVDGKPNTNRKIAEIGNAKNLTAYSVVRWLDSQIPRYPSLKVFFRTISPRHFFNGDWNTGGSCDNTNPLAGGNEVKQENSLDPVVEGAVRGTRVKILDITALSQLRDEGHISRYSITAAPGAQDCLHWCLPGVPDTWNEILLAQV